VIVIHRKTSVPHARSVRSRPVRTGWAVDSRVLDAAMPDASFIAGSLRIDVDWILTADG
jgi:hypothetical protein